ncbi:hypothetical protein Pmani_017514 [Petrolisthes manimaculis]|uniref:C-type lectin domain-containing protein n=1 Tax=Petrolisthes manimaculis TaxID=1843537 RepID=A0AAE1PMV4_9EUCA|nr:hypothetical protein Pmani_017514 [Petrolisthes manimaculis]
MVVTGEVTVGGDEAATTTAPTTREDRLAALEDTVSALVQSLRQESSAREVMLEGELMRRVEAMEGLVWRLENRLESLEDELGMLVFLDSRIRSTQDEQNDVTQLMYRTQEDVDEVRREVRQHGVTLTSLTNDVTQATKTTKQIQLDLQNYTLSRVASPFLWVGGIRTKIDDGNDGDDDGGSWRWVSGTIMDETVPWDLGEPDNLPGQRYVCIRSGGSVKFHDCTSTAVIAGVCQVK